MFDPLASYVAAKMIMILGGILGFVFSLFLYLGLRKAVGGVLIASIGSFFLAPLSYIDKIHDVVLLIWFLGALILLAVFIYQSIREHYFNNWKKNFSSNKVPLFLAVFFLSYSLYQAYRLSVVIQGFFPK